MKQSAQELIEQLGLQPHPEGGFFKEVHRSPVTVESGAHAGPRSAYTTIYFLLPWGEHSGWHRVRSDETWFFHAGSDLSVFVWCQVTGDLKHQQLGAGQGEFQLTVPADHWFAATSDPTSDPTSDLTSDPTSDPTSDLTSGSYSLVSCAVGPGFTFEDFELASEDTHLADWLERVEPSEHGLVKRLFARRP